ncbi:hypothetical protein EG856_00240 [Mycoplasmopsis phocirhinis]|uniref:Rho termination factor N-terminal domain-containing protein n=1 Tax=Mycoplasmopsis phocirhinis TaxID=142650 RepID=A0A4P6MSU8_9BACT|nr:hypothetical protein [Mycoplasmopsis phocirhinis]QBF34367.1 hypothetical protein EG856_00240 [Mycoplasmopsis phocirhinis]
MKREYLKITDTNQLWSLEKPKFRLFIIGACVSIALILLAMITQVIINSSIVIANRQILQDNQNNASTSASASIFLSVLLVAINIYIDVTYYLGVYRSYKQKSFEHISQRVITFYGIMSFISVVQLLFGIFSKSFTRNTALSPLEIASVTIDVLINVMIVSFYYGFIKETRFIAFAFTNAKALQNLKEQMGQNEELSSMFSQIFGTNFDNNNTQNTQNTNKTENDEQILQKKQEKEVIRKEKIDQLIALPTEKLFEIAKKLYISGYENMNKEELANLIYDILEKNK